MAATLTISPVAGQTSGAQFTVTGTLQIAPAYQFKDDTGAFVNLPSGSTAPAPAPVAVSFKHPGLPAGTHTVSVRETTTGAGGSTSVVVTAPPPPPTGHAVKYGPGQSVTTLDGHLFGLDTAGDMLWDGAQINGGQGTSFIAYDPTIGGSTGQKYGQDAASGDWYTWSPPTIWNDIAPATPNFGTAPPPPPTTFYFSTTPSQVLDPNGVPFHGRGMNVLDNSMADAIANLFHLFPGTKFVRLAAYSYQNATAYDAFVNALTAQRCVVMIENHQSPDGTNAGGGTWWNTPGYALEIAWYTQLATHYKNNPYVWFGTLNEASGPIADVCNEQRGIIQAIRGTGNGTIVAIEPRGQSLPGPGGTIIYSSIEDPSFFSDLHNLVWDTHLYPWVLNGNFDQATIKANFDAQIASCAAVATGDGHSPVINGEWGDAITTPTFTNVINGYNMPNAGWAWRVDGSTFDMTDGAGHLTPDGVIVAAGIAATP